MRRLHFCACGLICVLVMWSAAAMGQPVYHVTDLGALPSNFNTSSGNGIGNAGAVAGSSSTLGLYQHAFYWSAGTGMIDLGDFAGGNDESFGLDVNSLGHVVGSGSVEKADGSDSGIRPFLWSSGVGLQNLGRPAGSDGASANAINSLDQVVGHSFTSSGDVHRGFLWSQAGGFVDLGDLPDGKSLVFANDINDASAVVGSSVSNSGHSRAFGWTAASGMDQLADLSSIKQQSYATSINNAGYIVGTSENDGAFERAVLWKPGGELLELDGLPEGNIESAANAINNLNQVVGTANVGNMDDGIFRAFLWTKSGMRDLNTLLDSSGQGWNLQYGLGINDSGQIVGQGIYCVSANSCIQHAYLLTPVPEPGSIVLLGGGAMLMVRRRRVR